MNLLLRHLLLLTFSVLNSIVTGQELLQLNSYYSVSDHIAKDNCFSSSGSIYVTGEFNSELIYGMNSSNGHPGPSIYLSKQFEDGTMPFLRTWYSSQSAFVSKVAVKGDTLLVAGTFSDTLFVGEDTLVNEGFKAGYLVILDTLGNINKTWMIPSYSSEIYDACFGNDGTILLCGEFFNTMTVDQQIYDAPLGFNAFVIKLDETDLSAHWVNFSEGTATNARAVGVDQYENIYISGSYGDGTSFSGQTLPGVSGDHNFFITSYSGNGALNWVRTITGPVQTHGLEQLVTSEGDIYIGGEYEVSVDVPQIGTLINAGLMDAFLAKLDRFGDYHWAKSVGGLDNDEVADIVSDANGDPLFLLNGGQMEMNSETFSTAGFRAPLILKLNKANGQLVWDYRIPVAPSAGIAEAYSLDWNDSLITLCGSNRTGLFYFNEVIDSPNLDDSFWALLSDTLYTQSQLGFSEPENVEAILVFPNPTTEGFFIQATDKSRVHSVQVINDLGEKVFESFENEKYIEVKGNLEHGVYVIVIKTDSTTHVKKLLRL
jgi:hypothetical protein